MLGLGITSNHDDAFHHIKSKLGPFGRERALGFGAGPRRYWYCTLSTVLVTGHWSDMARRAAPTCRRAVPFMIRQLSMSRPDSPEPGPKSGPMGWIDFAATPPFGLIDSSSKNAACAPPTLPSDHMATWLCHGCHRFLLDEGAWGPAD
jgi:hypothetical protein